MQVRSDLHPSVLHNTLKTAVKRVRAALQRYEKWILLGIVDNSIYSHISLLQTNKPKWLNLQTDVNTEKGMKVGN